MGQNPTEKALAGLRSIVDAGGPSVPVRSHRTPTSTISPLSPSDLFQEKVLPTSDEPLAQRGVFDAILGGSPRSKTDDAMDVASMPGGLSFKALGALRGLQNINNKPTVFHGTATEPYEYFDLSKNDPNDTLGWMVHASEKPDVADVYTQIDNTPGRIIPITANAENALDITRIPEGHDWEVLKASMQKALYHPEAFPGNRNKNLLTAFNKDTLDDVVRRYDTVRNQFSNDRGSPFNRWAREHMAGSLKKMQERPQTEEAVRSMYLSQHDSLRRWMQDARKPFNVPKIMDESGFDAIRYYDTTTPAWAFAKPEQLSTPWGTPLGIEALKKTKP